MKQRAEKHLEIALGENMNIASLKPLALIEIMTAFAKKEVEAINYTRCCTELCDEENSAYNLQNETRLCDWCHKEFK